MFRFYSSIDSAKIAKNNAFLKKKINSIENLIILKKATLYQYEIEIVGV